MNSDFEDDFSIFCEIYCTIKKKTTWGEKRISELFLYKSYNEYNINSSNNNTKKTMEIGDWRLESQIIIH